MAFFDNFSKKVQDVAFVATEKAQQVAAVAGEKANAVADKAKTEYEMASERRSMDKNYRAIGEWYVSTLEGDAPEAVADIVAQIVEFQLARVHPVNEFPVAFADGAHEIDVVLILHAVLMRIMEDAVRVRDRRPTPTWGRRRRWSPSVWRFLRVSALWPPSSNLR